MGDAEGEFDAVGVHDVLVLNEDGLGGLGSEVGGGVGIVLVSRGTHLRFEHEFEIAGLGEEGSVIGIEIGDVLFLGGGLALKVEFFGRDLLIAEELGVELPGGFAGLVFVLIRLIEEDGVGAVDGPA